MFNNKFIVCVKVDGEIVREKKHDVFLPYGTPFSLFYKNIGEDNAVITSIWFMGKDIPIDTILKQKETKDDTLELVFSEDCELIIRWDTLNSNGYTETNNGMSIFLKGVDEVEQISEVNTVKTPKTCPSCGKKWKSSYSYCPYDGTYLTKD